ncbi:hypothetical protein [Streptomyces sp. NPDC093093]|uniref:hypothetical protein n=1 Tax=Streptomyces sp. NPDC093093 TaxID=3366025 RepID=UPI0037FA4EAB
MDRIYTNRLPGQRRIHIEIDEAEFAELLGDLKPDPNWSEATTHLRRLLTWATRDMAATRKNEAHEADTSGT